jgi:hypothetical protein
LLRVLMALAWLAMGAAWGYWAHTRVLRGRPVTRARRFVANWAGATCYLLGVAGLLVISGEGKLQRSRGTWIRWEWPEALAAALAGGLLFGVVAAFRRPAADDLAALPDPPEFPDTYVREILAAEAAASADECRRLARRLVKRARRSGQALPPPLAEFVRRHLPAGYIPGGV